MSALNEKPSIIPSFVPGDVVLTSFGSGVVTKLKNDGEVIQVRLWRMPFTSIASTVIAYLQKTTILKLLPAAPGMTTDAFLDKADESKKTNVMVHSYSVHSDEYIVSEINTENEAKKSSVPALITVSSERLDNAKSSKFYPLIEDLMTRADKAMSTTTSIVTKSSKILDDAASKSTIQISEEKINSVSTSIQSGLTVPDEKQISQVYSMMKDEELTVLLQKGQNRLKQLVSDEIPQAVEAALQKSGIEIIANDSSTSSLLSSTTIKASREKALNALNTLLHEHSNTNLDEIKSTLGKEFSTVFDSLSTVAKSDHKLNSIFDTISEKTSAWQEATGRLKATKSASLFIESTQRLKARAANLLSPNQLKQAKGVGMKFTKAFMEGDAAVARLKTIELGDEIRSRLVNMIEARSGSQGGLDGIIAGALTSISNKASDKASQENIQMLLLNFQQSASSSTKKAHETLLGTLSRQSEFREAAVLRIETVLLSLEDQLGDDVSAVDIAKLARGEGGTSALFEPIANRAAKEIENQLDVIEAKLTDNVSLSVIAKTREIITGKLTVSSLLDEAVNVLNDEKIVAHGEKLVKYGESVLDALEKQTPSKNTLVGGVVQIAEKAGLSKDSLMENVKNLDINKLLDTAGTAVTNEEARKEMLSSAGDTALEFLLKILPSMPVPPFDGVRDGLVYHLSNLSMKGFKVKKENIIVEIAGIRATKKIETQDNQMVVDFPRNKFEEEIEPEAIKATEVLIIDVQDISAILEDAIWSFEQTFFPYLKGNGKSFVHLSEGSIRLQFELRKRRMNVDSVDASDWEPVLCLHKQECSIGHIELKVLGESRIAWIFNKLSTYLKVPLRDYVVRTILDLLKRRSGLLLKKLNGTLNNFWGVILKTAKLTIEDLEEISDSDLVDAVPDQYANEVELVWREHLPLGLNLLMNDESGLLKVVDFPRGSQARKIAVERNLDPDIFKSATIMSVNGTRYGATNQQDLVDALRNAGRPKSVSFELANPEDALRIQSFLNQIAKEGDVKEKDSPREAKEFDLKVIDIKDEGPLGIRFSTTTDGLCLRIDEFLKGENDSSLMTEGSNNLSVGDILFSINKTCVFGENGRENALEQFRSNSSKRPLSLSFSNPYLHIVALKKNEFEEENIRNPAEEFSFKESKSESGNNQIVLKEFVSVPGVVESSGVLLGDHLVKMNGIDVGIGGASDQIAYNPTLQDIISHLLDNSKAFPATLTFARPSKDRSRWDSGKFELETAEKVVVTVKSKEELGCQFGEGSQPNDIIVTRLQDVAGKFQKKLQSENGNKGLLNMVVESVNGQVVPSYASASMVSNAIESSWTNTGNVEILFCEVDRKDWLNSISKT